MDQPVRTEPLHLELTLDPVFAALHDHFQGRSDRARIIEIGSHDGTTSDLLRVMCRSLTGQTPEIQTFEPDPRSVELQHSASLYPTPVAIASKDGEAWFYLSEGQTPGSDRVHTDSSSLQRPTKHLEVHPWCHFSRRELVGTQALDTVSMHGPIDLIWCDCQGGQRGVIRGGVETLRRTSLVYIEVHPEPLYEGEPTLAELHQELELLTECRWVVLERYPSDVLFRREPREG